MAAPRLIFIAGPNGAGKSTFYERHLKATGFVFVNADLIKAALGISDAEAAETAEATRIHLMSEKLDFIAETVFSDPVGAKLRFLGEAIAVGYDVTLVFIGITGPQLSEARVIQRVQQGGHDVPSDRLARRYEQCLKNLVAAMAFVPDVRIFDNSSSDTPHRLVLTLKNGRRDFQAEPLPDWLSAAL
jgi:predicted ABC-type ATPase